MKRNIISILLVLVAVGASAQSWREYKGLIWSALHGLDYEFRAGVNIGGTSPLPLPAEIRSIDSYKPGLAISIEGNVTKWIDPQKKWGVGLGLRLESKSMNTKATVKNYGMEIFNDAGGRTAGLWTGGVKTKADLSYLVEGDFSGNVYEGHLRTPDATGTAVYFEGDNIATYDFSDDLRKFQWGIQAGGSWKAYRHLTVHADLQWGLNDIFQKDFKTITFSMYSIYLNLGFGYAF